MKYQPYAARQPSHYARVVQTMLATVKLSRLDMPISISRKCGTRNNGQFTGRKLPITAAPFARTALLNSGSPLGNSRRV